MSSASKKPKNWKGQDQVQVNTPLHQWEVGARETSKTQVAIPTQGMGLATAFMGCVSLIVLCAFIYFLLHSPKKTPMIVVAPNTYTWPYIPSSWRAEDAKGFQFLSKKTLEVVNRSKTWLNRTAALADLSKQIDELSAAAKESGTVILYLALVPCVNDDSEPCLIPPEANPLEPEQWIRLKDIVDVMHKQSPQSTRKLIVIDPIQLTSNWHLGMLQSTFVDRLESWLRELNNPEIAILTAASDREVAWSGSDIRSSIFGREFRLGISGEADKSRASEGASSGNGDGIVTLSELSSYLQARVASWASKSRGVKQTPRIFANDNNDFPLAWALSSYEQGRQRAELATTGVAEPSVATSELVEIWTSMDKLRQLELYRYDPYGWAQLERRVVELGVLSRGGSAYSEQCKRLLSVSLKKRLTELSDAVAKTAESNCLLDRYGLFNPSLRGQFPAAIMPSLALKEMIGELDAEKALMARSQVRQKLGQAGPQNFASIGATVGLTPNASSWNEANFVALLNAFECSQAWQDTSAVQQLLDLRDNWEKLVSLGDIRVHRWSRSMFESGDEARRSAEDMLFAGESQEAKDAIAAFARIVESLTANDANDKAHLEKMVHLLDRAYSMSIPTAQWILQTVSIGDEIELQEQLTEGLDFAQDWSSTSGDITEATSLRMNRKLMERFREFAENIHNLDRLLFDVQNNTATVLSKGREFSKRLETDIDYFTTAIDDEVSRLTSSNTPAENAIPRLERLLEIPFLNAAHLQALNDTLYRLYQNRRESPNASTDLRLVDSSKSSLAGSSTAQKSAATSDVLDDIKSLSLHPVPLMLQMKRNQGPSDSSEKETVVKSRTDDLKTIDRFNAGLRQLLNSTEVLDVSRISDWLRLAEIEEPTGIDETAWSRAFVADRVERIMATLSPRRPEKSGVVALRNAALKEAMIWHSQRSLDDFYAIGTSFQSPSIHRAPFFAVAVKQIVNFAMSIPFSDDTLDRSLAANQKLVDVLLPATKTGFQTSVKTGPPILDRVEHEVDITVSQLLSRLPNGAEWVAPIPKGKAVLVVRTQDRVRPISNSSFPVPLQQESTSLTTTLPDLANAKNLQVVTVFRGHEFRAPLAAQRGITVEFEPKRYDYSDIVLFADRTTQPATVVILDCSWSMGEQIPIEAIDSPTQSRLDAAKSSILRILAQFAERPDSRVGIRLFGHRLGWSRPDGKGQPQGNYKTQLLFQPSYAGKIPDDLVPSRDVEAILPLGRFDASMIGPIADRLATVVPWGQSPLYHSITEAFGDFANDPENNAKCIVVITDGDNFQFAASNRPGGEPSSQTNLEDVERAWTRSKVPVFVLGVGISETDGKDIRQNLERLTNTTGGNYYDIQDGADLVRALSERLSVGTFRVSADSKSLRQSPARNQLGVESQFNHPVELPVELGGKNVFEIEFRSIKKSFQVEGGESLEMQLIPSGEDIVSIPYERNSPRVGSLVRSNSTGSMLARAHRPQMLGDGVLFPISFQDPNSHYTQRPKEVWMELTPSPIAEQGTAKYVYYDTPFEPGLPVPMIHWTVNEWPKGSTEADLSVWIKQDVTPAKWTIPLSRVVQESQKYSEGTVLDSESASQLRVRLGNRDEGRDTTIQITEIHNDAHFTSSYRVALELGDLGIPKRVVRRYEAGGRIAVHSFTLSSDVLQQALSSSQAQIKISTKEDILRGAWQLQSNAPIRVSIGSQVNLVPREDVVPLQLP
jgi:hypothetical protein